MVPQNMTLNLFLGSYPPSSSSEGQVTSSAPNLGVKGPLPAAEAVNIHLWAKEMATVWESPMHLASVVAGRERLSIHIHTDGCDDIDPSLLSMVHTSFLLAGWTAYGEERGRTIVLSARPRPTEQRELLKGQKLPQRSTAVLKIHESISDDALIDEDALLEDATNLLAPPPAMSAVATKDDDCGGRQPCDNCTCGRAENKQPISNDNSSGAAGCGKCGMGDAFRCASCPYLGKPAFKAGEEHLVLDLQDDL